MARVSLPGDVQEVAALLFDLDGTLADTAGANAEAYVAALADVGVVMDASNVAAHIAGRHWSEFLPSLLGPGREAMARHVADRKAFHYALAVGKVRLNEPLIALARFARSWALTALVTTASRESTVSLLAQHGLGDCFDAVVTGDDVERHKPSAEAYLLTAHRLGVNPEQCVVFEDSMTGVASARAAGMRVVVVRLPAESAAERT